MLQASDLTFAELLKRFEIFLFAYRVKKRRPQRNIHILSPKKHQTLTTRIAFACRQNKMCQIYILLWIMTGTYSISILGFKNFALPPLTGITFCLSPCGYAFLFAERFRPAYRFAPARLNWTVLTAKGPGQMRYSGSRHEYFEFH